MPTSTTAPSVAPRGGLPLSASLSVAAAAGLVIGWLDLGANEVQPIVALLLVAGGILGLVTRRRAWLVAIVLGLGVPAVHALLWLTGRPQPEPSVPPFAVLIAMIPAALGVAAGALVRAAARSPGRGADRE